jgi:hypothetical protein
MEFCQRGSTLLKWKTADMYLLSDGLRSRNLLALNTQTQIGAATSPDIS